MWICKHCKSEIHKALVSCWHCGRDKGGTISSANQNLADKYDAEALSHQDCSVAPETHSHPYSFSLRHLLLFTTIVAIFFSVLGGLLKLTDKDWNWSVFLTLAITGFLIWACRAAKCSNCGKLWRKRRTGAVKRERGWFKPRLEEYECKNCGNTEWLWVGGD